MESKRASVFCFGDPAGVNKATNSPPPCISPLQIVPDLMVALTLSHLYSNFAYQKRSHYVERHTISEQAAQARAERARRTNRFARVR